MARKKYQGTISLRMAAMMLATLQWACAVNRQSDYFVIRMVDDDTGRGTSHRYHHRVFRPFFQRPDDRSKFRQRKTAKARALWIVFGQSVTGNRPTNGIGNQAGGQCAHHGNEPGHHR